MSRFKRIQIFEPFYPPSVFVRESIFAPRALTFPSFLVEEEHDDLSFALDLLNPTPSSFELFEPVSDLIQIEKTPSFCSYKRIQRRTSTELCLETLCDRVSALESRFDLLLDSEVHSGDRKYTWTTEIKGPVERKYKLTAEIKGAKKAKEEEKKKVGTEKNYKCIAEIKGKEEEQPVTRKFTYEVSRGDGDECSESLKKDKKDKKEKEEEKKKKQDKKKENAIQLVEIEEPNDHRVVVLRQAFAKRAASRILKGKQKELSPEDAAELIQLSFRAYLIRRSKALLALRELAIAKAKLKEIRALFNNFTYRRHVARDAEERQSFSERIIVLLLTVDAIEGADLIVRAAKRSMVDELEAMLDVVDPQPPGKLVSLRRRTFDMPDTAIQEEIAEGVAQVVRMIENED